MAKLDNCLHLTLKLKEQKTMKSHHVQSLQTNFSIWLAIFTHMSNEFILQPLPD